MSSSWPSLSRRLKWFTLFQSIECCLESTGEDLTTLNPNTTTTPTPVRDKREIEEFEIEDFATTTRQKSSTNTLRTIHTTHSTFDPTADYRETTTELGTTHTTVSTFDSEANYTESTTEFQMIDTTTTNPDESNVRCTWCSISIYYYFHNKFYIRVILMRSNLYISFKRYLSYFGILSYLSPLFSIIYPYHLPATLWSLFSCFPVSVMTIFCHLFVSQPQLNLNST